VPEHEIDQSLGFRPWDQGARVELHVEGAEARAADCVSEGDPARAALDGLPEPLGQRGLRFLVPPQPYVARLHAGARHRGPQRGRFAARIGDGHRRALEALDGTGQHGGDRRPGGPGGKGRPRGTGGAGEARGARRALRH
jgi:hypothetical protein